MSATIVESMAQFTLKFILIAFLFAANQSLAAAEIDLIKADLKKSYPDLKDEELNSVQKFEKNKDRTVLVLYLKDKIYFAYKKPKAKQWTFTESIEKDGVDTVDIRPKNRLFIFLRSEGSSRSEITSSWRLEGTTFKIIGQDAKLSSGWNRGTVTSSVNYLSGIVKASSKSEKQKKVSGQCKFDGDDFRKQRLSDLTAAGANEPDCKFSVMPEI